MPRKTEHCLTEAHFTLEYLTRADREASGFQPTRPFPQQTGPLSDPIATIPLRTYCSPYITEAKLGLVSRTAFNPFDPIPYPSVPTPTLACRTQAYAAVTQACRTYHRTLAKGNPHRSHSALSSTGGGDANGSHAKFASVKSTYYSAASATAGLETSSKLIKWKRPNLGR